MDISQTYPVTRGVNAEKVIEDARTYLVGKFYNKELDFKKAKTLIFDNYDKRTFPEPKVLYSYLSQCEVKHYNEAQDEGALIVVIYANGMKHAFTVCSEGVSLKQLKEKNPDCVVEKYPPGSVLIGKKVFIGD